MDRLPSYFCRAKCNDQFLFMSPDCILKSYSVLLSLCYLDMYRVVDSLSVHSVLMCTASCTVWSTSIGPTNIKRFTVEPCLDSGEVPRSPGKWNWNQLSFLPFIFIFKQCDLLLFVSVYYSVLTK